MQSIGAELLVVPAPKHVEGAVPSMMDWALQFIPCSLWIVRESWGKDTACFPYFALEW